jgi:predicted GH43/DUF377 family glycosyl hydrolase
MEIIDIPTKNLAKGDYHFNGSIFKADGELWMAYRVNKGFTNASIHINRIDDKYHPIGKSIHLDIPNITKNGTPLYEDPRMFWYRGKLFCAFTFLRLERNAQNQGLVELGRNFQVERLWFFDYQNNHNAAIREGSTWLHPNGYIVKDQPTTVYEKNWQFFSYSGRLFFVYKINNHLVAEANLNTGKVDAEYDSKVRVSWKWGEPRGGTPPVLVDGKYWSFFHSHEVVGKRGTKVYHAGVYVFDGQPPFRPRLISSAPLLSGDKRAKKVLWKHVAVFPCGAILNGDEWLVSYGFNDHSLKIARASHESLKKTLIKI